MTSLYSAASAINMCVDVSTAAAIPGTLANSATYTSPALPLYQGSSYVGALVGYGQVVVALKSTQVVTITIQRYLDPLCAIPVGAAVTQATTANVAAYAATSAVIPALYWQFTIANASGVSATITNAGAMMLPNP